MFIFDLVKNITHILSLVSVLDELEFYIIETQTNPIMSTKNFMFTINSGVQPS